MIKACWPIAVVFFAMFAVAVRGELKPEPIPSVETLPADYPDTWIFAHDANFYSLIAGKVVIIDIAAQTREVKGMIDAAQMATFAESSAEPVLYVGETFYTRNTRGKRTDAITLYDKTTLQIIDEIILPNTNRGQVVTNKNAMQLIDGDRFLLVYGFTPAQSIIVVDTKKREVVEEVSIAGCAMAYPTGKRGFMSLCSNGSLLAVQLDEHGQELTRTHLDSFFDIDQDPLFDKAVYGDGIAYFVSYLGEVQPIDVSGPQPKLLPKWSLVTQAEASEQWRPGGWQISAVDQLGRLYVIMHAKGYDGSHKFGGESIWVFDTKTQEKISEMSLEANAFSIEVTASKKPLLAVTNTEMGLDVYSVQGEFQRSINVSDSAMPIILHAGRP